MIKLIRFPEEKTGLYWLVNETTRGITPLHRFGDKVPEVIQALPDVFNALDEADTAFVCLNICDDLTPQARGALRRAWAAVQGAMAKLRPSGAYSDAVKDSGTAWYHENRERRAFADTLAELKLWHYWAQNARPGYQGSTGEAATAEKIKAAQAILDGHPKPEPPEVLKCLRRAVPWLAKMIVEKIHEKAVAPKDCENTLAWAESIIELADAR